MVSLAFAVWSWFRPYEWNPDPSARCTVEGVQVTPDRGFFWVETHLKVVPRQNHDLQKPVFLEVAGGRKLEPADTTFVGSEGTGTTEIWLKFWLEKNDITGPLTLHLNDGKLSLKAGDGVPAKSRYYVSNHW